ncbi:putative Late nodulin [Medicago truncatula]|uniref:Late nodulin n=1 Tax=Medicago truncatula TaxID=3880 RepID=G7KU55_MEDTR|nr:late nodulin [Medicago truncatula]AFK46061.1 unknown [Medicago truncatula]RHN46567.1 putative Late nodulin [Medicago truncatula]
MADVLKFVYIVFLFVSQFCAEPDDNQKNCVSDSDCYKKFHLPRHFIMKCIKNRCTFV